MKVLILGSDEIAAHVYRAVKDHGSHEVDIYATRINEPLDGAYWLQWLPETIFSQPDDVTLYQLGNKRPYLERCWERYDPAWAPDFKQEPVPMKGWPIEKVWENLWEDADFSLILPYSDTDIGDMARSFDIVFMCHPTQEALRTQSPHYRLPTVMVPRNLVIEELFPSEIAYKNVFDNWVIQNGLENRKYRYLRMSYLWGRLWIEYPRSVKPEEALSGWPEGSVLTYRMEVHPNAKPWLHTPAPNVFLMGKEATYISKMTRPKVYLHTMELLDGTYSAYDRLADEQLAQNSSQSVEEEQEEETANE